MQTKTEAKPALPPHLVALFAKIEAKEKAIPAFTVRDVTPAGYGPVKL